MRIRIHLLWRFGGPLRVGSLFDVCCYGLPLLCDWAPPGLANYVQIRFCWLIAIANSRTQLTLVGCLKESVVSMGLKYTRLAVVGCVKSGGDDEKLDGLDYDKRLSDLTPCKPVDTMSVQSVQSSSSMRSRATYVYESDWSDVEALKRKWRDEFEYPLTGNKCCICRYPHGLHFLSKSWRCFAFLFVVLASVKLFCVLEQYQLCKDVLTDMFMNVIPLNCVHLFLSYMFGVSALVLWRITD
jgi:hypothetical protein